MGLRALLPMSTRVKFVVVGVVFLFLPAMTVETAVLIGAAIFVAADKLAGSPVGTLFFGVLVKLRFASEVLPVVGKHAHISLMLCFVVGTPHRLEVEHVEVCISFELVYQFHRYLWRWVRKRTILPILALIRLVYVGRAEFGFVLVWVVKLLNPVVGFLTGIPLLAFLSFSHVRAHFWLVGSQRASLILFLVVVIRTPF